MDEAALLALDRAHVWHPYGPQPATQTPLVIGSAEGVRLRLRDGRELIDGMASWWCAIHGYRHPALDAAARAQLDRMSHVMFGGLTHEPAVALAAELVAITPPGLEHVFFADSGSVAVEVALKMVLQAARATNGPQKCRVMAFRGGYHGDTFGAMGLCDPVSGMHHLFADQLPGHVFAPRPPGGALDAELADADAGALADLFAEHGDELAAVFVEPVVQGAGGMWFSPAAHLRLLRELCDLYGVLLVADEIATGFYRTGGHAFACGHAGVTPDVLCVGKALTGGYLTLSAALCTPDVAAAISEGEGGALMHGPTFMGNPLACAIAGASLRLLADGDPVARVAAVEAGLQAGLGTLRGADGVVDVRVRGALGVVQLDHPVDVAAATAAAVAAGVWVRPFRDLVYVMPAYVMDDDDVASLCAGVRAAAAAG